MRALVIDGCDEAILGYVEAGDSMLVAYGYDELIDVFMAEPHNMDRDGAVEWIDFNILGAYMGEGTPVIVHNADRGYIDDLADQESDE